jgi:dihydropteroate synthase
MAGEPIRIRGRALVAGGGPFVFGILNVTPDSFSDGGRFPTPEDAVAAGLQMVRDGADVIDVGGESTRPGSERVPPDEQIRRTHEVISALSHRLPPGGAAISIDTTSAEVAEAALDAGATIINDISALRDDREMPALAAARGCGVILMHMQGSPADMQNEPHYTDVVAEVRAFLSERLDAALAADIRRDRIILDPGIGFGKTVAHNLELLANLQPLRSFGLPVMIGPSRKRFIRHVLGGPGREAQPPAAGREAAAPAPPATGLTSILMGTAAVVAACVLAGVECLRVHDVPACRQVAQMCTAIRGMRR